MKLLYAILLVFSLQQVVVVSGLDKKLARFFASPDWKQSLAKDAPIISPEETLQHLKALKHLIPKNKNKYLDDDQRTGDIDEIYPDDGDWDRNENYQIMATDLKYFIEMPELVSPDLCGDYRFKEFWSETESKSYLTNPDEDHFGPNMKAYFMYFRKKNYDICKNQFTFTSQNVFSKDLTIVDDITKAIVGQLNVFNAKDIDSVIDSTKVSDALMTYINAFSNGKKANLKEQYYSIMGACVNVLNGATPNGFIEVVLKHPDMSDIITGDTFMNTWAAKIKVCRYIHAHIRLDDLEKAAGYSADFKGKVHNVFHRH